jgi:hypothetical protein
MSDLNEFFELIKGNQISELQQQLTNKDNQIAELQAELQQQLTNKDNQIAELQGTVNRQQEELNQPRRVRRVS